MLYLKIMLVEILACMSALVNFESIRSFLLFLLVTVLVVVMFLAGLHYSNVYLLIGALMIAVGYSERFLIF